MDKGWKMHGPEFIKKLNKIGSSPPKCNEKTLKGCLQNMTRSDLCFLSYLLCGKEMVEE